VTVRPPPAGQPPNSPAAVPTNLAVAALRIDDELHRRHSSPVTLSPQAGAALEVAYAEYLADLGQEAIRIARRDRLSIVDREHVEQAVARLGLEAATGSALGNGANSIGGLLAGAGIASSYALAFTKGPHGTAEIITAIVLCIIGFSVLAIGMTLTMVNRR
jgi:hypothetical protein